MPPKQPESDSAGRTVSKAATLAAISSIRLWGRVYSWSDKVTEFLLYAMIVFSSWALGATDSWAVWTLNITAYVLGLLHVLKRVSLGASKISPPRWEGGSEASTSGRRWMKFIFALNVVLLLYIVVGALNNRATFIAQDRRFIYHNAIAWLPHSYDRDSSLFVFWYVLGLTCVFWSARDWLLGRGAGDTIQEPGNHSPAIPLRLRRLLWVLSINGALLAIEGIIQRLEGSGRLLFIIKPYWNRYPEDQFGPWAYRANAAQYFNLIWPVAIGFWLWLAADDERPRGRRSRVGSNPRTILLPIAVLMAACPFISSSRGGAIIDALLSLTTILFVVLFRRKRSLFSRIAIPATLVAGFAMGMYLGWDTLKPRLAELMQGETSSRQLLYRNARQMTRDFYVLGSGAGTFGSLYQLYRSDPEQDWEAFAHNDWLEALITLGAFGETVIVLAFLSLLRRSLTREGIRAPGVFYAFLLLSIAGCLIHATFDFPLQVYSVLFIFILFCSVLSSFGKSTASPLAAS